jgi:hypothetical protein
LEAELVRRRVDVIVTTGGIMSGLAAKAATDTSPIVAVSGPDPVVVLAGCPQDGKLHTKRAARRLHRLGVLLYVDQIWVLEIGDRVGIRH